MAYRRDRKGRRTRRLLIATALSITPAIHGCGIETPSHADDEQVDGGNPKGSFYDEGLLDGGDPDDGYPDVTIFSNPKGCFFDQGLADATPDAGPTDGGGGEDGGDGSTDGGDASPDGGDTGAGGAGGMDGEG